MAQTLISSTLSGKAVYSDSAGVFCHTERLRDHPARLKLDLSDSTMAAFGWSEKAVDPSEQLSLRRLAFR